MKESVEQYWSDVYGRMMPKHKPELVEKACKTANWREGVARQVFLSDPLPFESTEVLGGQRTWFCNALTALTREEVIALYDALIAGDVACLETGGDFTCQAVRDRLPHIYARQAKDTE